MEEEAEAVLPSLDHQVDSEDSDHDDGTFAARQLASFPATPTGATGSLPADASSSTNEFKILFFPFLFLFIRYCVRLFETLFILYGGWFI